MTGHFEPLPAPYWIGEPGPEADVVVSTRVRLARNLSTVPFPWRCSPDDRLRASQEVREAASGERFGRPGMLFFTPSDLGLEGLDRALEWRYVSRAWLQGGTERLLAVATDGISSMMVHEEDHLRLQTVLPGLQVELGQARADSLERWLAESLPFSRSVEFGFLTSSLTNVGTGMRVSVMLHLPGLAAEGRLAACLDAALEVGCAVRGLFGEGTEGTGSLYQVSNSSTYGESAQTAVARAVAATRYLVQAETEAREKRFRTVAGRLELEQSVHRDFHGVFAETQSPEMLLNRVSAIRLAVAEKVLGGSLPTMNYCLSIAGTELMDSEGLGARYGASRKVEQVRALLSDFFA